MKIIAIHQPAFFPWLGFFDKIVKADIFVILDDVQYPKTGGYWSNRVKIIVNSEPRWITMPIVRSYSGVRKINEMLINNKIQWRQKILRTIELNYKKAAYFDDSYKIISELLDFQTENVFEFNMNILSRFFSLFKVDTSKIRYSSHLKKEGIATDLLISIIKNLDGDTYLYGAGAGKYQEDEKFSEAGIKLIPQNFQHLVYHQINTESFVEGLSVIDAVMNCGIEGARNLIFKN